MFPYTTLFRSPAADRADQRAPGLRPGGAGDRRRAAGSRLLPLPAVDPPTRGRTLMPEGDTVHRQCRLLHDALAAAVVSSIDLRVPRAATADLTGWSVREVLARGKHLLLRFDPPSGQAGEALTLHNHLMMDGIWHIDGDPLRSRDTSAGPREGHTARIVLHADHADGRSVRAVGYDVKQVRLLPKTTEGELLGHLGPDLLDPHWKIGRASGRGGV